MTAVAAAFFGAYLLFVVEPLTGRALLPSFGGSPATWATCLVFFQACLLLGYAYAHLVATRLGARRRLVVHAALVALACVALPWRLARVAEPAQGVMPELAVLLALAALVGVPATLLATTTPLLDDGSSGVRKLYAWSNAGSLAGLLTQPLVLEPLVPLSRQALGWSVAFVAWAALVLFALRRRRETPREVHAAAPARSVAAWVALAAAPSALLVATTTKITQDVAPIPLLWAVPLALYLLTYVACFARPAWAARRVWLPAAAAAALGAGLSGAAPTTAALALRGAGMLAALVAAGMLCHGELARRAPQGGGVTAYYLSMAAGGVAGSALVTLAAPLLFDDLVEYRAALVAPLVLVLALVAARGGAARGRRAAAVALGAGALALAFVRPSEQGGLEEVTLTRRSFFGVLRVVERRAGPRGSGDVRILRHGSTAHGLQFLAPGRQMWTTAYYGPGSGAQVALDARRAQLGGGAMRVGVVGLGAGTLAACARAGDVVTFYEIDPKVTEIAESRFSFLSGSAGRCDVRTGDGRLLLRDELGASGSAGYDVLAIDAFSGDCVPTHLLTREFLELARAHLAPGGILAFHVTNRYLDLSRPASALAVGGLRATLVESPGDRERGTSAARWMLLADGRTFVEQARAHGADALVMTPAGEPWTDDHVNVIACLRW